MALDFPSSPSVGTIYPNPAVAGQPQYTWDGEKWTSGTGFGNIYIADTAPAGPVGSLWWESDTGLLYVRYSDGTSTQWVIACPQPDISTFLLKAGDTMTGPLLLSGNPTQPLHAVPKQYSDLGVRSDFVQTLTAAQQTQAQANVGLTKKNYVINGAMMVSQENGTAAGTVNEYYPVDQFSTSYGNATGVISVAQVANVTPAGSPNRIRCTVTTADAAMTTNKYYLLATFIEGLRCADLKLGTTAAKTVTLQFGCRGPAGTYCISYENAAQTRLYVAEFNIAPGEANTDVVKSVTIPGDFTGTWATDNTTGIRLYWALMCGPTYQGAPNAWGATVILATANQFNFMGTAGNVFELFDVSLTEGSVAPPFMVPDYASERTLCRRYFISEAYSTGMWLHPLDTVNFYRRRTFLFRPEMRAAPTMTVAGVTNTAFTTGMPTSGNVTPYFCELQGDLSSNGYAYITSVKANVRLA